MKGKDKRTYTYAYVKKRTEVENLLESKQEK